MPLKAPRMVEAPASWAGWYIGLHAGAAWHDMDAHNVVDPTHNISKTKSGSIGGGQIGYNWQRGIVGFGFEADISGLSSTASGSSGYFNYASKISWLSTVRGRLGVTLTPNTLLHGTGDVAIGGVKNTFDGWVAGGGIEYMLSRNWTVGAEGLFLDLGSSTFGSSGFRPQGSRAGPSSAA